MAVTPDPIIGDRLQAQKPTLGDLVNSGHAGGVGSIAATVFVHEQGHNLGQAVPVDVCHGHAGEEVRGEVLAVPGGP